MVKQAELMDRLASCVAAGHEAALRAMVAAGLSRSGDDGLLVQAAALIDHSRQQYTECRQKLESALVLSPLRPAAWCGLADGYLSENRVDDAKGLLVHVASLSASSADLLRFCASRLDGLGESTTALETIRRAVQLQPENAQAVYEFGYFLARAGHPPHLVVSMMERAVSLAPHEAIYRVGLAKVLTNLGQIDEAVARVRSLSARQLDQITCRCCLEGLVKLFESCGDRIRAHACRVRAERLPFEPRPTVLFDPLFLLREFFCSVHPRSHGSRSCP